MSPIESSARALLDDLASRRRLVTRVITDMSAFYGLDPRGWLDDAMAPSDTKAVSSDAKPATRETKGLKRDTKGAKRETRPTPAPTETQERILTALKTAGEPVSPGELAKAVRMPPANLFYHLKGLKASGRVKVEGASSTRKLSLAS